MKTTWTTLATLFLALQRSSGIPHAQQEEDALPQEISEARDAVRAEICAPDYVPSELVVPGGIITDRKDARLGDSGVLTDPKYVFPHTCRNWRTLLLQACVHLHERNLPLTDIEINHSPHDYTYVALPLRSGKQIIKMYIRHVVREFDAVAQGHTNFDEPIPPEGFNITLPNEFIELHITQHGDKNLVWGNVKNAIVSLKNYYADPAIKSPAYLAEVIVQLGFLLEGYVRMIEAFPFCTA